MSEARHGFSLSRALRVVAGAGALAISVFPIAAQAQTVTVPRTYPSKLSPAQIAQLSANATQRVIVVLRDQHPEASAQAQTRSIRRAKLAADQAPILAELHAVKAPRSQGYSLVNAVAATVSKDEASLLASNPAVAGVIPDAVIKGPTPAASAASAAAAVEGTQTSSGAQQICPADPSKPILEPEALQLMNVDFGSGASQPAAHDVATGKGVKIAVFPDGLDPNIPDFKRTDGSSAIFDYVDFSGEGLFAQTGGGEAFGDASSLISQANQTFDLSGQVNPGLPLPPGCNIQIKGVAPDASVAVMKVFGNSNFAFNSEILTGIEHAINVDKVDILSQSFGGNPVPNPGLDPIALLDSQAVAAGITVVVSTGDAGTTNTIGTPSNAAGVISAGATTSYRLYAQTSSYGYQLGNGGWLSNEVSAFSSSGDTEYGPRTIDVVAPGENGWADCSTDTKTFTNCADIYHGTNPQPLDVFGGTSESCPLTAGTAALVIQAYRDTHGGATPAPALVKQILMSSATDLHIPAQNQGAGLVNALRAVQLARTIGATASSGGLLMSPNSISTIGQPGHSTVVPVTVTNTGSATLTVTPSVRALGTATPLASGALTLNPTTDPTFLYMTGATAHDLHEVTFNVPAGTDRLVSRIAWHGSVFGGGHTIRADLFDPAGRMAAQSRPQGAGGGFGEDEIHDPGAGTWTLVVFDATGSPYSGSLAYSETGASFQQVAGTVSPASAQVAPGGTATFAVNASTPAAAGDQAESVVFATSNGVTQATIPVTTRALVPITGQGGSFSGQLTGGNARMAFYGQELVYQFDVPAGQPNLNVDLNVGAPGYQILGFLVDPTKSAVDVQGSAAPDGSANNLQTTHLTWANPVAGRWSLDLTQVFGSASLLTSVPVTGVISFNHAGVTATGLPLSKHTVLHKGRTTTATIHVVNTGNSPALYSVDPRLNQQTVLSLASITDTSGTIPFTGVNASTIPQFVVPPFSTRLDMAASSTVPITFDTSPAFGYPDLASTNSGNNAVVSYEAADLAASIWACPPSEVTINSLAVTAPFSCSADAQTSAFDPAVDSSTGNIWSALEGLTANYNPLILQPGQAGDITVTITPSAAHGSVVSGFIAVETFAFSFDFGSTFSSDQLVNIPYTYRVG